MVFENSRYVHFVCILNVSVFARRDGMKEGEKYCSWKVDKTFLGKGGFFLSTVSYHKVMTSYLFVHLFFFFYIYVPQGML